MNRFLGMAPGWTFVRTDDAGIQQVLTSGGVLIASVPGNGRTAAGIGSATNRGRGRVIITAHGSMIHPTAGYGVQESRGRRRGGTGAAGQTISDGLPSGPEA